jgi:ATP-dependent 26S proteasome regulatory subunit
MFLNAGRLIDNEVKAMKNEMNRLTHEVNNAKERIKENNEKIKLNKQLPYLVGNIVEVSEAKKPREPAVPPNPTVAHTTPCISNSASLPRAVADADSVCAPDLGPGEGGG